MASTSVLEEFQRNLENKCREICLKTANNYIKEMNSCYRGLIEKYYAEFQGKYIRSGNLKKSGSSEIKTGNSAIIATYAVDRGDMQNYLRDVKRRKSLSADKFLDKFIYNKSEQTFHGGDYVGGYGVRSSINFYKEMNNHYKNLVHNILHDGWEQE